MQYSGVLPVIYLRQAVPTEKSNSGSIRAASVRVKARYLAATQE